MTTMHLVRFKFGGGAGAQSLRQVVRCVHSDSSSQSRPELKASHTRVLADIRELYELRPTPDIFERAWHKDAVFEDPLVKCHGFREYAAQWYAMPKLFSKSETVSWRVISATPSPIANRIVFSQQQRYQNRFIDKTIDSVVTVDLDDADKIIRLVEQWDGKDLPGSMLRRLNGRITPLVLRVPS
ncbi:hypothetical protein DFH06DRAFT_1039299 [Mycena polygramma]|nr:hypothetical protein DFH06DRAFT_1039299 [Mycena polygramma]